MDRRRWIQAVLLIVINIGFFLILDFFSPMPVVFDGSDDVPSFRVEYRRGVINRYDFFLIYPSEQEYASFTPIEEVLEGEKYGEFIQYEVEFLEEIDSDGRLREIIQAGFSMDVGQFIGGHVEEEILDNLGYLEEKNGILFTPYISIDRNIVTSSHVLSLQPNMTEKARLYSELLAEEGLDHLIIAFNSSSPWDIVDSDRITSVTVLEEVEDLNDELSQLLNASKVGILISKTSTIPIIDDKYSEKITVYCETQDIELNITTKQFTPISSAPERYEKFKEYYIELTGEPPTYTEALLYDTCRIFTKYVEISRYRPWDTPEAFWETAKTLEGVTGNCTLTVNGDRMYQEYIIETIEN